VRALFAGAFFALLAVCISLPQSEALRDAPHKDLPTRVELTEVPFHKQDDYLCGPASLAMALRTSCLDARLAGIRLGLGHRRGRTG